MELGKLNSLTRQIIDKTINDAQTFKPEVDADMQLKNFFANLYKEDTVEEENGNIQDIINSARTKREGLDVGIRPTMGLESTEDKKASEKIKSTVEKANKNDKIALQEKEDIQIVADENNDKAEQNLAITKNENEISTKNAETEVDNTKEKAQNLNIQAENKEQDAKDNRESAESNHNQAKEAVSNAAYA
jgi:hypothetical protein